LAGAGIAVVGVVTAGAGTGVATVPGGAVVVVVVVEGDGGSSAAAAAPLAKEPPWLNEGARPAFTSSWYQAAPFASRTATTRAPTPRRENFDVRRRDLGIRTESPFRNKPDLQTKD
jgi:hypothetical protein